jgi:YbbR domain-containing protein
VNRLIGFVVHNWPLKLAAVALATLLYAGLVLSQNARVWPGRIPIQAVHQPPSAFILGQLPDVQNIRYFAPVDAAERLSSAGFSATIDLTGIVPDPASPIVTVPVKLVAADPKVSILSFSPAEVFVRLDPIITSTVPVRVSHGTVPEGLQIGEPQLSQASVTVSGPQSVVSQIVAAEARVRIQSSGIDVDQLVDLVPVDGRDEVLTPVEMNPTSVRVRIPVGSPVTTKSVPVTAVVTGTPGNGFVVGSTTITPAVATVTGEADTLTGLTAVQTKPVDVSGAATTVQVTVGLDLPDGISAVGDQTFAVTVDLRESAATRSFSAGLIMIGAEPSRSYTLGADTVVVTLGGGDQALNQVDAASFAASINVTGLTAGSHDVDVRVVPPGGLKLLAISPTRVTVFVSELATPPPTPSPSPSPTPSPSPEPTASAFASGEPSAIASPSVSP